ncbi:SEC14 cytosolic factor-like isoform X2 [Dendronephthya gigantea]|uniref:SEC14 cytosolic factor-like isoform X2 n=1 Tax=Dendronephthya gigantea TaxID=151771 RepID=UPI00106DA826|nr:SEC14 cytosolic factor-like isoform X2 [Dendronephthya gigantea]
MSTKYPSTKLTKSEEKALADLREKLSEESLGDEATLLRFLRARDFNVDGAYRQYIATWEWRRNNDIDNILTTSRPLTDELKNIMSYGFHKFDKEGRPCYIEKTGRVDIAAFLRLPEDQIIRWHVWNTEKKKKQIQQMVEKSIELNKEITTLDHIHDLGGATLNLRKGLSLFTRLTKLDQEYYPERVGKIFLVNTPWAFPYLWKIAKTFLDPKTRDKCVVLNSTEMKKMLDYFEAEDLPEEYGGTCCCKNGCLPEVPKHMLSIDEDPELTEEYIAAKKSFSLKIECDGKNESIGWFYRISQKDIKFGVSFLKHSEDESLKKNEEWIFKPDYPLHSSKPNVGFHHCSSPGTYTLIWDNSQSRFLSRTLKYHVMVSESLSNEQSNGSTNLINNVEH